MLQCHEDYINGLLIYVTSCGPKDLGAKGSGVMDITGLCGLAAGSSRCG